MKRMDTNSSNPKALIRKVEDFLSRRKKELPVMSLEVEEMLYGLQAQNEELRKSQVQSEELKKKYQELFNLAPVAYFCFDTDFLIKEVNTTAEKLLFRKRVRMLRFPFVTIVAPLYRNLFYSYRLKILETKKKQTCELKLRRGDGKEFYSLLESVPVLNEDGSIVEIHSTCSDFTEHRQSELKKQSKLIQTSVENMLDPFAILRTIKDKSGSIVDFVYEYINEAGSRSIHIDKEEIVGKRLLDLFPSFKTNGLYEEYCRVFQTGETSTLRTNYIELINEDRGLKGIFDFRINRLNSGVVVTWRNITEKIKAEEQILKEKKRLEILTEISEIFASVSADFKIVSEYTTRKLAEAYSDLCIINILDESKTQLEIVSFHHPDKIALEFLTNMFTSDPILIDEGVIGQVIRSEKAVLIPKIESYLDVPNLKSGYRKYVDGFGLASILSVPIIHQNNVIGSLSLFRNRKSEPYTIEDQILLQNIANKISLALTNNKLFKALASQKQLLQSVMETIPVGVWIIDNEGNKVLGNEAVRQIWKENQDDTTGNLSNCNVYSAWRANSGESIDLYKWSSEKAIKGEVLLNEEVLIQCFDGSYKTILNSTVPIIKDNGKIQDAIIVNVDITDRKNYEVRLQQTLDELERSNRELEQFAYIASHDLQEPLRMVSSYTQLLEKQYKDKLDPRAIEYISFAVQGAKRMQALIVDLLKYARVTTRAQAFEPVDCNNILKEVVSDLKMAIEENNAVVTSDPLPEIFADPTQIRQLLQNLVGNAMKFHSKSSPQIKISAQIQKGEWLFSVQDNGIGIDPRHFDRIFMLFQRLHERDKYSGTGIGLAVCKKIVERHGGRIWVDSEVSKGTNMLFTIPIRNQER